MYTDKIGNVPTNIAEHISLAEQMAKEIVSTFNPVQQNEMLWHIKEMVSQQRQLHIEELEMTLARLKDTLQQLK